MPVLSTMPPRKLRVFAFDPSLTRRHQTVAMNEVVVSIPWEMDGIAPEEAFLGPVGEYVEVVDFDPTLGLFYLPVNLHDAKLLSGNGLPPSEWNPQFHQQMVYAVAMNTIAHFEKALGRVALWASHIEKKDGDIDTKHYVRRLRIYPHALREANAYYSPRKKALLFGYFKADAGQKGAPPGITVFTCLSHDIIAHETSHALLDGMHPLFGESTNPDVLALHEAFSDIVAIFQHFSYPDVLKDQIARTRGDLESQNLLGQLAQEFGQVLGRGAALRDALGGMKDGEWRAHDPDPNRLQKEMRPHARGSILVAAVFRAFLSIYRSRIADLLRIASGGTGILPPGELHPDLVARLAREAAKSAEHMLEICIRALDYCPPVDVTFGDYFRAIITADHDLYPDDDHHYRTAIMEAFLAWGIVPRDMPIVSTRTLLWPTLAEQAADYKAGRKVAPEAVLESTIRDFGHMLSRPELMLEQMRDRKDLKGDQQKKFVARLKGYAKQIRKELDRIRRQRTPGRAERVEASLDEIASLDLLQRGLQADRKIEWLVRELYCGLFWCLVNDPGNRELRRIVGITTDKGAPMSVPRSSQTGAPDFEVHSVRMATRRGNRDQMEREYVVELVQTRHGFLDKEAQAEADKGGDGMKAGDFKFRRGCTLLIDANTFRTRRVIRTVGDVCDDAELDRMRDFLRGRATRPANAFTGGDGSDVTREEAFAHLHRHYE